ncbi:MAG: HEAT repeat domain-containing protein [Armatimonadota bacterium]
MLDSVELWKLALSEDYSERRHAANRLCDDECADSTEILQHLVSDSDPGVRICAVYAIERQRFDGCVPLLVRMMHDDPNFIVRRSCAHCLTWIPEGATAVVEALDDLDELVIGSAITSLQANDAIWASDRISEYLMHPNWEVRYSAACALLKFGIGSQQLVDTFQELTGIADAREMVSGFAFADALSAAKENIQPQTDPDSNFDEGQWDAAQSELYGAEHMEMEVDERLEVLRAKFGPELVPYPQADPLGDMLKQAQQLIEQP